MKKQEPSQSTQMTNPSSIWNYEPNTGKFYWKQTFNNRAKEGEIAGSISNGHVYLFFNGKKYMGSRVAVTIVTGTEPANNMVVVPRDGNKLNLKYLNLEVISKREKQIRARTPSHNTSDHRGVSVRGDGKKYIAHINPSEGKAIHLGNFNTIEEAIEARRIAETKYY